MLLDGVAAFQFLIQDKPKHFFAILKAHLSFYALLPKFLRKRKVFSSTLKYYTLKSIVFQYFINNKKKFNRL